LKNEETPKALSKKKALTARKRVGSRRPRFRQQESWRYKRVKERWRRPDGIDSKMRKKVKGWPKSAKGGYRGPKEARGLHPSGYAEVLVRTVDDVDLVDAKTHAVRIAHTVGAKKRVDILARARQREIYVLNPKEAKELEEKEEIEEGKEEEKKT